LLAEFASRADALGRLVLSGSASELEGDLPFSVFVDALDEYLRGLEPSRLRRVDEDVRTELAHVFPSLSALATAHEVALQHERYRSHRAVRALFEHLARSFGREGAASRAPEISLTGIEVPAAVTASLREELGRLSERGRRVLEGAAVAGDPFEPELAAAAAETSEPEAMDAIDELS